MNLTPKSWAKSEVMVSKNLVKVGTKLTYSDCCNYRRFTVTAIEGSLMTLVEEDGYTEYADLDALQIGWKFGK